MPASAYKSGGRGGSGSRSQAAREPPVSLHMHQPTYPPSNATIQAYEANLIWDEPERATEQAQKSTELSHGRRSAGRGLIQWHGEEGEEDIWIDRYDILHLLPSLPSSGPSRSRHGQGRSPPPNPPHSPTASSSNSLSSSWADLPSDLEQTFELSSDEEFEAYEREKKKKWIDALREERLRERAKEDQVREREDESTAKAKSATVWKGDDEVPPDPILTLMSHTAMSLSKSPNPSLLEMRILANHSTDERFAFLRGRWKDIWVRIKDEVRRQRRVEPGLKEKEERNVGMLVGGYESDEPEDEAEEDEEEEEQMDRESREPSNSPPPPPPSPPGDPPSQGDRRQSPIRLPVVANANDEDKRLERRRKVEEWKMRREAQ
ncbi:hypothetical protein BD324DRAFT_468360 [Kockovaella imperatae]|uniref:SURP motif domain-containing protein n=1 Tax=Kockovaella imperatae TaxID=4999 RepID=A0A1Y1UH08_9TREE|nr:hypothetical protein BD324DRAFT_468360 [Kockovaella imperatae]ORX36786.1 hypothetical protein BD324DRAFT_468360 [Kockovaella imperatae]